jgi:signal transduction histidine kinase/DNA-binding response OmpR family regulator
VPIDSAESAIKEAITFAKTVKLKYDEGYITIKFAALNFINAEKNQYAYKLDGLSNGEDWHYAGTQRTVSYANLEPGTYTFKVMASNNDGIWNKNPISLNIVVLPPWWLAWWAYLMYSAAAIFLVYWIVQFFRNRARLKRELYLEHLQNERQEELHQMKIDFFTNISHEIRTPLTLILGPLEKMISSAASYPALSKQLEQVQHNAFRLMRLVTELMDFRKSEDGHMKLSYALCDLVKFSKEIFMSFQNLADDSGIQYNFQSHTKEAYIYFDKDHFEKVIFNLLANAFKFTPKGGAISFLIEDAESSISIRIADNGKGIAAEHLPKLFNRFYQVSDQHAHQGYGIGLALSKSIVELHHGKIEVQSTSAGPQNHGATIFTVSLLKGSAHLDPKQLIPEYMNSDNPDHYYLQSQAGELIGQLEPAAVSTGLKLLIIEDNAELRAFIRSAFQDQYEISEAANGLEGLKMALLQMPDLVISDVMMPEMDGLELCRCIKSDERINHIPVILLTARAAYIHQVNGLQKGADAYITKPFSIQVLELNVKNVLATRLALRKRFTREVLLNPQQIENPGTDEKFLQKLMTIIESELDNPDFDVTMIVEKIGMSKTVLYKKVNALINISIADLIKTVRLKKAALLLETNQISIAEVAFSVGFNDRKYFSKEFKKLFQMSPSEYIASKA